MSYPPHHHRPGYPPYPSGGGPPSSGLPYPSGSSPYPPGQVYPPSLGFKADAPMYMPTPGYPPPSTPSNAPSYPNSGPPGPAPSSTYPYGAPRMPTHPQGPQYPVQTHHVSKPTYPANPGYPSGQQSGGYPAQSHHTAKPAYPVNPSYPSHQQGYSYGSNVRPSVPSAGYSPHGHTINSGHVIKKGTPTVVPAHPFDPRADAEVLRKAMKGFGTDEKSIIKVLSKRSNAQRLIITTEFKTMYGKDLIKDLKSETSGKFEDLLVALMTPLPQFYAKELNDAIRGLGTDEDVLIEVLCTKSNNEIRTIRQAYASMFGKNLEDDLIGDTSGTFKRLMVSLCNACRDESMGTNQASAANDARELLKAGELRLGTDESTFNMVLCQRNYAQLRLIFEEYFKITGHDIEQAIKNEFSGNTRECLLTIIRSIRNQPGLFAKCLHNSIAGLGTNDKKLIRVVVTRCEIDMGEIKQNYLAQYGKTLADDIKGDTSGDYKKLLLALIGES